MILFEQACAIIRQASKTITLQTETIPLENIHGRICAEDILAPLDIQPFDNSSMDGFAVRCQDLKDATADHPIALHKTATIFAGQSPDNLTVQSGTCIHIMTGAVMPSGANAVIPIEQVSVDGDTISFYDCPNQGANIRRAGEDFTEGQSILQAGDTLNTAHILPLATLGIGQITVYKKPTVMVLTSGDELVDDLNAPLQSGQIYNSNAPYLKTLLEQLGADVIGCHTVPDCPPSDYQNTFVNLVQESIGAGVNIIVSCGAVSAGASDFVKGGLQHMGAEILYHKIQMRPGKPNLFARLQGGCLYFGLPGNPVSGAVGGRFFVHSAMQTMLRQQPEQPLYAVCQNDFSKPHDFRMFLKAHYYCDTDGIFRVSILDKQISFMTSPFLQMNGWVMVDENTHNISTGNTVPVYPLTPPLSPLYTVE